MVDDQHWAVTPANLALRQAGLDAQERQCFDEGRCPAAERGVSRARGVRGRFPPAPAEHSHSRVAPPHPLLGAALPRICPAMNEDVDDAGAMW